MEDLGWRNTSVTVATRGPRWILRFGAFVGLMALFAVESKLSSQKCRSQPPNPQFRQA